MGGVFTARKGINESAFLAKVQDYKPINEDGVKERLSPGMPDYQSNLNAEFEKFVTGQDSAIYLGYQPIWNPNTRELCGLEVLCRCKNGADTAPMPGLAIFQVSVRDIALKFLVAQCDFAVKACKALPGITVSVNVRPDELQSIKEKLIECSKAYPKFIAEITEYSPIGQEELDLMKELVGMGVHFALDDVTEVKDVEKPPKCFGTASRHACTFQLAKERTDLFAMQKLSTPMSCSVWRVDVFPTPKWAGGAPEKFLQSCVFEEKDDGEIQLRKRLVDEWIRVVKRRRPDTVFVMECSVYPEDLVGKTKELYLECGIFDGMLIQGGKSGGRIFPLEYFRK